MAKLLYVKASPRGALSRSVRVADALVDAYGERHTEADVNVVDLFRRDLPAFDGPVVEAKYAILHGEEPTDEQRRAWGAVEALVEEFASADVYVFATPMWNFGIPYRLKHYVDLLVQPTYTFAYSAETGYTGLVTGKPAVVVCARGGAYAEGEAAAIDMQWPYLRNILGFIGFTDVRPILVEPMLMAGPDVAEQALQAALAKARETAATL